MITEQGGYTSLIEILFAIKSRSVIYQSVSRLINPFIHDFVPVIYINRVNVPASMDDCILQHQYSDTQKFAVSRSIYGLLWRSGGCTIERASSQTKQHPGCHGRHWNALLPATCI